MEGWDDIDALTADLDNVLNGFDILGVDDDVPAPTPTPVPAAAPSFPQQNDPPAILESSKKKKVPAMPPGHASHFSSKAAPPPGASTPFTSKPPTAAKPNLGATLRSPNGVPRPVARPAEPAAALQMPKASGRLSVGLPKPATPATFGGSGFTPKPAFAAGPAQAAAPEYTPNEYEAGEEEYNVLEGNASQGNTPDHGVDDRFGPGSVWFHGKKKRAECEALIKKGPNGTYLVRESTTSRGDYVLSCKESDRMSHYIITSKNGRVTIGDRHFGNIPLLVKNYQTNILETTKLLYPVDYHTDEPRMRDSSKSEKKAKALYNFAGDDDEDLAFSKGDILTVIDQSEPNWWRARDKDGNVGVIPHNYVDILMDQVAPPPLVQSSVRPNTRPAKPVSPTVTSRPNPTTRVPSQDMLPGMGGTGMDIPTSRRPESSSSAPLSVSQPASGTRGATFGVSARTRKSSFRTMQAADIEAEPSLMPAASPAEEMTPGETYEAKAIMTCHPNAYDPSALSFKKGDTVIITKKDSSGTWEGEANGKRGHFPCSYVE